jgi:hypothetical protein
MLKAPEALVIVRGVAPTKASGRSTLLFVIRKLMDEVPEPNREGAVHSRPGEGEGKCSEQ